MGQSELSSDKNGAECNVNFWSSMHYATNEKQRSASKTNPEQGSSRWAHRIVVVKVFYFLPENNFW
jgi:hypothetical protein